MIKILVSVLNFYQSGFVIKLLDDIGRQTGEFLFYYFVGDILPRENDRDIIKEKFSKSQYSNISCFYVEFNHNLGYARGNNKIIMIAKEQFEFDYILICNPDITMKGESVVWKLVQDLQLEKIALVGPKVVLLNGRQQGPYRKPNPWAYGVKHLVPFLWAPFWKIEQKKNYSIKKPVEVWRVIGAIMLIKKDEFDRVGMFDESTFLYWEEDILSLKFSKHNLLVLYDPTIEVLHNHQYGFKINQFLNKKNIESMEIFFCKLNSSKLSIKFCKICLMIYYNFWLFFKRWIR
jgi:GT2 family glycosyltransferase